MRGSASQIHIEEDRSMSSPDPLALSPPTSITQNRFTSPLRSISGNLTNGLARTRTPLRTVSSPSKTITMSTGKSAGSSPWKIKVTVEAQREDLSENDENDAFCVSEDQMRTRSRTVQVPLRDHDASPKAKPRLRSNTPVGRKQRKSGTPVRRRRRSITRINSDDSSEDDSRDLDFSLKPTPRRDRGKAGVSKAAFTDEELVSFAHQAEELNNPDLGGVLNPEDDSQGGEVTGLTEMLSPPTHSSISPPATASPLKRGREDLYTVPSSPPVRASTHGAYDSTSENAPSRTALRFTKLSAAQWPTPSKSQEYGSVPDQEGVSELEGSDYEDDDDIEPTDTEIGDKTMMESEGFSMVSLESVESARDILHISSTPSVQNSHHARKNGTLPTQVPQQKRVLSVSTTVSTAEEHPSGLLTPSTSSVQDDVEANDKKARPIESSHATPAPLQYQREQPPPPLQAVVERRGVSPAAMQSTITASQALHQAMGKSSDGVSHEAATPENGRIDQSVLHGFSASTRKRLHDGLRFGESLAQASPRQLSSNTNDGGGSISPSRPSTEGFFQTPKLPALPPLLANIGVAHPSIAPTETMESITGSKRNTLEMDWQANSPPVQHSMCISPDSMEARWRRDRDLASTQIQQADPSEVITISSEEEDSVDDMRPPDEREDVAIVTSNRLAGSDVARPRTARPLLSRSWRRQSAGTDSGQVSATGESGDRPHGVRGAKTFWQPGTSLEPSGPSLPSIPGRANYFSTSSKAGSPSSGESSVPTPSPDPEEVNESNVDVDVVSERSTANPLESPDEDSSTVSNDTGLFWHRNLPGVYDKDKSTRDMVTASSTLKSEKIDLSALLKSQTPLEISPLRTPGHGLKTPQRAVREIPTLTSGLRGVLKSTGPSLFANVSPAKSVSRVSFAELDETRDISSDGASELDTQNHTTQDSSLNISDTMSSDVRQLHAEIEGANAIEDDETPYSTRLDVEDDSCHSASHEPSASSLQYSMSETSKYQDDTEGQETQDESTCAARSAYSLKSTHAAEPIYDGYSRTDATMICEAPKFSNTPPGPGMASRVSTYVWSYIQPSIAPVSQLSHPLLKDRALSLLPRLEPWTKTHYKMLDKLYQRYRRRPELFDPSHADNEHLGAIINHKQRYRAGPDRSMREYSFADWDGAEMKNWGYGVKLTASHIVVAALFTQLLVLDDANQYEQLVGEKIQAGDCNPGTPGEELGVDKIVFRLFSIMHGEKVRRAEKRGGSIERSVGTGFVRLKDCDRWTNYM